MTAATIYAHPCAVNWLQLHCTQFDSFLKKIYFLAYKISAEDTDC